MVETFIFDLSTISYLWKTVVRLRRNLFCRCCVSNNQPAAIDGGAGEVLDETFSWTDRSCVCYFPLVWERGPIQAIRREKVNARPAILLRGENRVFVETWYGVSPSKRPNLFLLRPCASKDSGRPGLRQECHFQIDRESGLHYWPGWADSRTGGHWLAHSRSVQKINVFKRTHFAAWKRVQRETWKMPISVDLRGLVFMVFCFLSVPQRLCARFFILIF